MKVWTGVLFFDGACGMCTRSRDFLVRHDRTGNLETEPLQARARPSALAFARTSCWTAVRWLDSSGAVYSGAEALGRCAGRSALGTRLPLLIYRIPGIRFVQNAVYRWVADHRYRFPGKTPYCESHPVAC